MDRVTLKPIGRLVQADADGILPRIGQPPHPSWSAILGDITEQLGAHMPDQDFALLTRGSVARGASVEEAADLDLVILLDDPTRCPASISSAIAPQLKIETSIIARRDFVTDGRYSWMRFVLAHNGHTVFGPDILPDLPEPKLGDHCYAHLRNADKWLAAWEAYWTEDKDYLPICEWMMKRIVRSLFESQITTINAFSRDIYPCAQVAITAFPDQREAILDAASLAVAPTNDHAVISGVTDQLSGLLLAEQAKLRQSMAAD